MTEIFMHAFVAVRGVHGSLLQRARTERGASMVEYALLVGLIAIVAVIGLLTLGPAIQHLFQTSSNCVSGPTSTTCTP
jgi:pilus assembly protein Flp/PilA